MSIEYTYVHSEFVPRSEAVISIEERGFRFGDGIFETIRVSQGKIYNFPKHLARLKSGLEAIKLAFDTSPLLAPCLELIKLNNFISGFIRVSISRGIGSEGYLPTATRPLLIIETIAKEEPIYKQIKLCLSSYTRPDLSCLPANAKLMQGLTSSLARIEAKELGCDEALLLNERGYVSECSSSNIFWVKNGIIYTPSLACSPVAGTTRATILELTQVIEGEFTLDQIKEADELFISSTGYLVTTITEILGFAVYKNNKVGEELYQRIVTSM